MRGVGSRWSSNSNSNSNSNNNGKDSAAGRGYQNAAGGGSAGYGGNQFNYPNYLADDLGGNDEDGAQPLSRLYFFSSFLLLFR